jgi:cardiolipin synthase
MENRYSEALLLFIVAGVSDAVDGFLAKHCGWSSKLGSFLDPLADKLLLVGTVLALNWQGELPSWLVLAIIFRDVMIVTLAIGYHYLIAPFKAEPLLISKLNTLMQLTLVTAILFSKSFLQLPDELITLLIYGTGLTTLLSGAAYVITWGGRTLRKVQRSDVS